MCVLTWSCDNSSLIWEVQKQVHRTSPRNSKYCPGGNPLEIKRRFGCRLSKKLFRSYVNVKQWIMPAGHGIFHVNWAVSLNPLPRKSINQPWRINSVAYSQQIESWAAFLRLLALCFWFRSTHRLNLAQLWRHNRKWHQCRYVKLIFSEQPLISRWPRHDYVMFVFALRLKLKLYSKFIQKSSERATAQKLIGISLFDRRYYWDCKLWSTKRANLV